jgi:hypothetical protein
MINATRRLAPGFCLSPSRDGSPLLGVRTAVARLYDPAYKATRVLPEYDVGDPSCERFSIRDRSCIQIAEPYNAPHGQDSNTSVDDRIGREA